MPLFIAVFMSVAAGAQQAPARGGPGSLVSVSAVETRTTSIGVAGRLEPARRIVHTVGAAGVVERVYARVGDAVTEGQVLATIGRDEPGESYRPLSVVSRVAGRVSEVLLIQGAEVKAGAEAVAVVDDSAFRLVAALSDKDAFRVADGGASPVVARSADGVVLRGDLVGVSTEPDYATGLFDATLRFAAQPGARIGMVLFMDLPVESVRGQFVAQGLVVRRFGRSVLWVVGEDDRLRQVQVTTGRPYGADIQVLSGLAPGTRYPSRLTGFEKEGMSLEEYREAQKKGS
jgi:multidrug efflux pump subunit AcrA (membrane-fusion protein)